MTAKRKRLDALEARQAGRVSAYAQRQPDTLSQDAQRVCLALPEDLQATVRERGARGYADLLEAWWYVEQGEDFNPDEIGASAQAAYRLAFGGEA